MTIPSEMAVPILSFLDDISPRDSKWVKYKISSFAIADIYSTIEIFHSYADRINDCSSSLHFVVDIDFNLRLISARFCRVRYCVVCQWRRSMMWKAKAIQSLSNIVADFPKCRFLFLTLTVRNCDITNLRETLKYMNQSFVRLFSRKRFSIVMGSLRSTEVTMSEEFDDEGVPYAHPHFHCLLMVKASYFSGSYYLTADDWSSCWQKALKSPYKPVIYVTAISQKVNPKFIIPELLKYSTKPSDLAKNSTWLIELTKQTHKMRFVATAGVFKKYMSDLDEDPDDLIGKAEDDDSFEIKSEFVFDWDSHYRKYKLTL